MAEEPKERFIAPTHIETVIDGATFIADSRRIELWGIKAPAEDHSYFQAARMFFDVLTDEGDMECLHKGGNRYHCLVDGVDIAALMVEMGVAEDIEEESAGYYRAEERFAKRKGYGIWKILP